MFNHPLIKSFLIKRWFRLPGLLLVFFFICLLPGRPAHAADSKEIVPVYRLYNTTNREHLYTVNPTERDNCIAAGWKDEGIGWYAPRTSDWPVRRIYHPGTGYHLYSQNPEEMEMLSAAGWKLEGVAFYSSQSRAVQIRRQFNQALHLHNYSYNDAEIAMLGNAGWKLEGTAWFGCAVPRAGDILLTAPDAAWQVTQYKSVTPKQSMCYTIEDDYGHLIVIDGGYEEDAPALRQIISDHGNCVDLWILTHGHADHTGAFNTIAADPGGITIRQIYTVYPNMDLYRIYARDYDEIEHAENMMALLTSPAYASRVRWLAEGDSIPVFGMKMQVLHAWDEETDAIASYGNLCNNGGLIFTLTGHIQTMLFLADCEEETEDALLTRHADQLARVDYVQTAHHGNWGVTSALYDAMPEVTDAFFDAPDAILEPVDTEYDAWTLTEYFAARGVAIHPFRTAPNIVTLQ